MRPPGSTAPWDGWTHKSGYVPRTNIFRVNAASNHYSVSVETLDYAEPNEDIYVRHYRFMNRGSDPVSFRFVYFSSFRSMETQYYHTTQYEEAHDCLTFLRRDSIFSISSSNVCTGYTAGHAWEDAQDDGYLNGSQIQMSSEALGWNFLGVLPGTTVNVPVYIGAGTTRQEAHLSLDKAKSQSASFWYNSTAAIFMNYRSYKKNQIYIPASSQYRLIKL